MFSFISSIGIVPLTALCLVYIVVSLFVLFDKKIVKNRFTKNLIYTTAFGMVVVVFNKFISTYYASNAKLVKISGNILFLYAFALIIVMITSGIIECKRGNISEEKKKLFIFGLFLIIIPLAYLAIMVIFVW